jgi:transposase
VRYARQPTQAEEEELERMTQQEVGRVALRAQMVQLSRQNYDIPEIGDIQQCSSVTVYKWLNRFNEEGPQGLYDRPRSGRPPKIKSATKEVLDKTVSAAPLEEGYNFTYWTVPLLTQHLKEKLKVEVCQETVRNTLYELGFRWRRPRWAVKRQDPHLSDIMKCIAQAIFTSEPDHLILVEDETIFKTLPPLRRMWMRQGHQHQVPTPADNNYFCLYGVLELLTGDTFHAPHDKGNSEATIDFLQQLLDHFPGRSLLLLWDQARYHTSHKVEAWLAEQPRLRVMLLPKYAAHLNLIEAIWRTLKDRVAANLSRSLDDIQQACDRFFEEHSPLDLLRLAGLLIPS